MLTSFGNLLDTYRYLPLQFLPYKYYFYNSNTESLLGNGFFLNGLPRLKQGLAQGLLSKGLRILYKGYVKPQFFLVF